MPHWEVFPGGEGPLGGSLLGGLSPLAFPLPPVLDWVLDGLVLQQGDELVLQQGLCELGGASREAGEVGGVRQSCQAVRPGKAPLQDLHSRQRVGSSLRICVAAQCLEKFIEATMDGLRREADCPTGILVQASELLSVAAARAERKAL